MFIIKLLSQHVSGIIMPGHNYAHHQVNKSVQCRIWCSAQVMLAVVVWSWEASCVHCDNKHQISCILLVSLSSPYVHDARPQEPKI